MNLSKIGSVINLNFDNVFKYTLFLDVTPKVRCSSSQDQWGSIKLLSNNSEGSPGDSVSNSSVISQMQHLRWSPPPPKKVSSWNCRSGWSSTCSRCQLLASLLLVRNEDISHAFTNFRRSMTMSPNGSVITPPQTLSSKIILDYIRIVLIPRPRKLKSSHQNVVGFWTHIRKFYFHEGF